MCSPIIFLYFQGGVTEFYILTAIVICCHLQAPVLYNHHEQETLPPACALCMAGRVSDHFLTPYASPPAGLVCFQCHWSIFVWLFPPFTIVLFRYMVPRNNWFLLCFGYLAIHFGLSDFVIYVHYQDYSENPICQSEKKGLLQLFLSHDCHLHLLWKLYIHVC